MKVKVLAMFACITLLLIKCGGVEETSRGQPTRGNEVENKSQNINKSDEKPAITIAKDDFVKTHGSLETYNIVLCDRGLFWLVLFDPQEAHVDGIGVEYAISKQPMYIVESRSISLASPTSRSKSETVPRESDGITKEQALDIAKRDAVLAIGSLSKHDLTVCELSRAWLIVYSPKEGLSGGGPEYVVDKNTGKFLDRRYTQ